VSTVEKDQRLQCLGQQVRDQGRRGTGDSADKNEVCIAFALLPREVYKVF